MHPPHGQEVSQVAPVHPNNVLVLEVIGHVRNVGLVEQRQVGRLYAGALERGVEAINTGLAVAGAGRDEAELRARRATSEVKSEAEDGAWPPRIASTIETH